MRRSIGRAESDGEIQSACCKEAAAPLEKLVVRGEPDRRQACVRDQGWSHRSRLMPDSARHPAKRHRVTGRKERAAACLWPRSAGGRRSRLRPASSRRRDGVLACRHDCPMAEAFAAPLRRRLLHRRRAHRRAIGTWPMPRARPPRNAGPGAERDNRITLLGGPVPGRLDGQPRRLHPRLPDPLRGGGGPSRPARVRALGLHGPDIRRGRRSDIGGGPQRPRGQRRDGRLPRPSDAGTASRPRRRSPSAARSSEERLSDPPTRSCHRVGGRIPEKARAWLGGLSSEAKDR